MVSTSTGEHPQKLTIKTDISITPKKPFLQFEQHLEVLRDFDLNSDYGPCLGITRMERWERARGLDLSPPENVKIILQEHPNDDEYKYP